MNFDKMFEHINVFQSRNGKYEKVSYEELKCILSELDERVETKIRQPIHNPFMHGKCRLCKGTGIERSFSDFTLYGKTPNQILKLIDFAEQHGYKV